jgi:phosphonate transport system substrate-binding protein
MKKLTYITCTLVALILFWGGKTPSERSNTSENVPTHYTFAVVPQFASPVLFQIWTPILKELSEETGIKFKLDGHSTFPGFEKDLSTGSYDFAYVNPYHAVMANRSQGYAAILCDKSDETEGILVAKKTSTIDISALKGAQVAFPSPNTLASSILMQSELKSKYQFNVKPQYLNTHTDVYMGVYQGTYKAGSGEIRTFELLNPKIKDQLKIIHKTQKIPSHPVVAHARVPQSVREKVVAAFEKMSKNPTYKAMFQKIPVESFQRTNQDVYNKITFNTSL